MPNIWKLSDPSSFKQITRAYANRHIDFEEPGFFDSPQFLAAESLDPRFLVTYARFVEAKSYSADMILIDARRKIAIASEILRRLVFEDGRFRVRVSMYRECSLECWTNWESGVTALRPP